MLKIQKKQQQNLYIELLKTTTSFSNLFSNSLIPYLYYRTHENIFSLAFNASNLAREDISIDAKYDYIILPLYSAKHRQVEKGSGLNHWNTKGRRRDENEVYIPIPSWIHKIKRDFFNYNTQEHKTAPFEVVFPNGKTLNMKVCQAGGKALMSNPNNLLGKWISRDLLNLPLSTLVARELLDIIGRDSIKLIKIDFNKYEIQFLKTGRFEIFEKLYKKI